MQWRDAAVLSSEPLLLLEPHKHTLYKLIPSEEGALQWIDKLMGSDDRITMCLTTSVLGRISIFILIICRFNAASGLVLTKMIKSVSLSKTNF